jgi:dihydroorotase
MDLLIKSAKIVSPTSAHNGTICDVLIRNGKIERIGQQLEAEGIDSFSAENLHLSPGWFDMHANFCDPGHEYKEDLCSGTAAAANGGFTGVAIMPSTTPPIATKADVEYVRKRTEGGLVDVYPTGTVSAKHEGKELAEMYDMHKAGAIAFTDDKQAIANPGLMSRALLYSRNFDGLTISFAHDNQMAAGGNMNEGPTSTSLGLRGIPNLAEELHLTRDLYLAEYTEAPVHFCMISTARSVDLIRDAKARGLRVTAEVAAHQLLLDDTQLEQFDTNLKVLPPLRNTSDIDALKAGLKDGTIDSISSDHTPEDIENKQVEFDHAAYGMSSIETAFSAANTALEGTLSTDQLIEKLAVRPREILKLDVPQIEEGAMANLTLFDPTLDWTVEKSSLKSKSSNSPFIGKTLKGKALAVFNNNQWAVN